MFKEIFASILLATSFGTPAIKQANNVQKNYLFGGYCLIQKEDDENYSEFVEYIKTNGQADYIETNTYNLKWYDEDENEYQDLDKIIFAPIYNTMQVDVVFYYDQNVNNHKTYTVNRSDQFVDVSENLSSTIIYFKDYTLVSSKFYIAFNLLFSKYSNDKTYNYTGWYTFSQNVWANDSNDHELYGNIMAGNTLYNYMEAYSSIYVAYWSNTTNYTDYIVSSQGDWHTSRNIYFTDVLISEDFYRFLQNNGTFQYVPTTETSDFQDLFFALADTPIYYITTWFNFEILGFNIGVAIVSMMTLLVIVFVIKKLI